MRSIRLPERRGLGFRHLAWLATGALLALAAPATAHPIAVSNQSCRELLVLWTDAWLAAGPLDLDPKYYDPRTPGWHADDALHVFNAIGQVNVCYFGSGDAPDVPVHLGQPE